MSETKSKGNASADGASRGGAANGRFEAAFVAFVVFALLTTAAERVPLAWDEGDAFVRAERVAGWTSAVVWGPKEAARRVRKVEPDAFAVKLADYFAGFETRRALFSDAAVATGWQHAVYREGHPAGYSIAIAAGRAFARRFCPFLSEKVAFRFGPICLFALALAVVFRRVSRLWGRFAGWAALAAILGIPRVVGHSLIGGGDSLLISSWLLAWATFDAARRSKRGAALWGLAVGISFSAKFSGFVLAVPFVVWTLVDVAVSSWSGRKARAVRPGGSDDSERSDVSGDRAAVDADLGPALRRAGRVAVGLLVAALVFWAANPPLWARPFSGFATFFSLNVGREGFDVPIWFFGRMFSTTRPLPFWNGFFWLAATIPVPTLVLSALGVGATSVPSAFGGVRRDAFAARGTAMGTAGGTAILLGLALPIVRAFPGTPAHDGARLLIASFPLWGVLAGVGAATFVDAFGKPTSASRESPLKRVLTAKPFRRIVVAAVLGVGLVDCASAAPQFLSFYNALVGGLDGAVRRGLEPTYYWDAFDADVAAALNVEIDRARREGRPTGVLFGTFSTSTLDYCRRWKTLETAELATISNPDALRNRSRFGFYVAQRRPSGTTRLDLAAMKSARPILRKTKRDAFAFGKARPVVLLDIYRWPDVETALAADVASRSETENRRKDADAGENRK